MPADAPSVYGSEKDSFRIPAFTILACMTFGLVAPFLAVGGRLGVLVFKPDPAVPLAKLDLWLGMIGVQAAAWALISAWAIPCTRVMLRRLPNKQVLWRCLLCALLLLFPLLASGLLQHRVNLPPRHIAGVPIVRYFGILGLFFGTAILFLVFLAYETVAADQDSGDPSTKRAIQLSEGMRRIQQFFIAASIVLGLGVIGTATQRNAVEADAKGSFPIEYVLLFGTVGSLVLLAAYAPIRIYLYQKSKALIDEAAGPPPLASTELKAWLDLRSSLETLFGQDVASVFGLGGALPLFLPVIVGAIGKLTGG